MKKTPITPEALEKMGFIKDDSGAPWLPVSPKTWIDCIQNGDVRVCNAVDDVYMPGVRTIEDLQTLLRFLGKEEA